MGRLLLAAQVALLAAGLAAAAFAFSLWHAVARSSLPGADGSSSVHAVHTQWSSTGADGAKGITRTAFADLVRGDDRLTDAFGVVPYRTAVTAAEHQARRGVGLVDGPAFRALGVRLQPPAGDLRSVLGEDAAPPRRAIVSTRLANEAFGSPEAAVGQFLELAGSGNGSLRFAVSAVAPPAFRGFVLGQPQDVWVEWNDWPELLLPAGQASDVERLNPPVFGLRLREGVDAGAVQSDLDGRASAAGVWNLRDGRLSLLPGFGLPPWQRAELLRSLNSAGVLAVLLAAMLLATIVLERMLAHASRKREYAVRRALGEPPAQTFRTEARRSVVIVLAGAALSVPLLLALQTWIGRSQAGAASAAALESSPAALWGGWLLLTLFGAMVAGVIPQVLSREIRCWEISALPRHDAPRQLAQWIALAIALLVSALAVSLVTAAGREISALAWRDYGFDPAALHLFEVDSGGASMDGLVQRMMSQRDVGPERQAIQDVLRTFGVSPAQTAFASAAPVGLWETRQVAPVAPSNPTGAHFHALVNDVSANYFDLMGIRLLAGLPLDAGGDAEVVVNRAFALRYFGKLAPLGEVVNILDPAEALRIGIVDVPHRIIGIVEDAQYVDPRGSAEPTVYRPLRRSAGFRVLLVRHDDPAPAAAAIDAAFRGVWPQLQLSMIGSTSDLIERELRHDVARKRWLTALAILVAAFAATALTAHLSSVVNRRLPELAVMRALGANRLALLRSLLRGSGVVLLVAALCYLPISTQMQRMLWPTLATADIGTAVVVGSAVAALIVLACAAVAAMSLRDTRMTALLHRDSF